MSSGGAPERKEVKDIPRRPRARTASASLTAGRPLRIIPDAPPQRRGTRRKARLRKGPKVDKGPVTVRFGIIGGGHRGVGTSRGDSFARALAVVGATVTAFYDTVEENARRAADAVPGARPFTDWEAFLASGIEAVVIASPVHCHAEQAVACLERGLHVLSEVTAASNLEDARRLAEAARRSSARSISSSGPGAGSGSRSANVRSLWLESGGAGASSERSRCWRWAAWIAAFTTLRINQGANGLLSSYWPMRW